MGRRLQFRFWIMVFIEPISGAVGSYYDIIRCFSGSDYVVFGVFRGGLWVYRGASSLFYGVVAVVQIRGWWFRCVPALLMVFQMCPKSYNDVFTSPTRLSEPYVGFFCASPSFFWV